MSRVKNLISIAMDTLCEVMSFLDVQSHCRCSTVCKLLHEQSQRPQSRCSNLTLPRAASSHEVSTALLSCAATRVIALDMSRMSTESTRLIIEGVLQNKLQQESKCKGARKELVMPMLTNLVVNWHLSVDVVLSQQQRRLRVLQLSLNEWSDQTLSQICGLPLLERLLLRFGPKCAVSGTEESRLMGHQVLSNLTDLSLLTSGFFDRLNSTSASQLVRTLLRCVNLDTLTCLDLSNNGVLMSQFVTDTLLAKDLPRLKKLVLVHTVLEEDANMLIATRLPGLQCLHTGSYIYESHHVSSSVLTAWQQHLKCLTQLTVVTRPSEFFRFSSTLRELRFLPASEARAHGDDGGGGGSEQSHSHSLASLLEVALRGVELRTLHVSSVPSFNACLHPGGIGRRLTSLAMVSLGTGTRAVADEPPILLFHILQSCPYLTALDLSNNVSVDDATLRSLSEIPLCAYGDGDGDAKSVITDTEDTSSPSCIVNIASTSCAPAAAVDASCSSSVVSSISKMNINLNTLTTLDLSCCQRLTNSGIAHLQRLSNLRSLNVYATSVTASDGGDGWIITMPRLVSLTLPFACKNELLRLRTANNLCVFTASQKSD